MSFLNELKQKKTTLKSTQTIITRADGCSFVENYESRVGISAPERLEGIKHGYVVDTKPDKIPVEVIKHLFIGSQDCVELDTMKQYDITCVLSLGIQVPCEANIEQRYLECLDLPEMKIESILTESNKFISKNLDNNKNVLVHCNAGVSRSAMVILGFLMIEKKMSYYEAFSLLKSKRSCIQPNVGFVKQLQSIENNQSCSRLST